MFIAAEILHDMASNDAENLQGLTSNAAEILKGLTHNAAEILQAKTSRVEEILCVARFSEILNRCFSILRKDIVEGPRIPTVSTSFLFRLFPFFSDHSRNNGRESRD